MPSEAASRRAAALSPIARIAAGGGPTQRIPAALDAPRRSRRSRRGTRSPGWTASAPAARAAATTAGDVEQVEARPGPSVAGTTARIPSRSQVRVIRRGDLAAVGDEQRSDRGRRRRPARPVLAVGCARTRQSRQTRHASDHQRAARAADRSRSSAGRTASSSRAARRPGLDSVRRASCRDCRTCPDEAPTISSVIRRRGRP